jgi:hypothetical protein
VIKVVALNQMKVKRAGKRDGIKKKTGRSWKFEITHQDSAIFR